MTGRLAAGMCVMMASSVYAQQADFMYDNHGKRDPFGPLVSSTGAVLAYDAELTVSDMNLEGILADPKGNNLAIINGKVVKTADRIGPWQVETIGMDNVDLAKDGEKINLKLKKGLPLSAVGTGIKFAIV